MRPRHHRHRAACGGYANGSLVLSGRAAVLQYSLWGLAGALGYLGADQARPPDLQHTADRPARGQQSWPQAAAATSAINDWRASSATTVPRSAVVRHADGGASRCAQHNVLCATPQRAVRDVVVQHSRTSSPGHKPQGGWPPWHRTCRWAGMTMPPEGRRKRAVTRTGASPVPVQEDEGGLSPVPAQMRPGPAQSRCRCERGNPSPGADVAGVSPSPGADVEEH